MKPATSVLKDVFMAWYVFYNKSALIKVALEVHCDGAIIPTNFTAPKICFVPYKVKHISATNQ